MNKGLIIQKIRNQVKKFLEGESTGHDWWHAWRVWTIAKKIAKKEGGDLFILELAALLHDIEDWKFNGRKNSGIDLAKKWLSELKVNKKNINHICHIIENISFKGAGVKNKIKTKEGKIVQDADRLDVLGAIGIARTFAYGGYAGREIHNPKIKPRLHRTFKEYREAKSTSINHFYEKLLLIKDRLNTETAKKMATKRHQFLKEFLKEFLTEWEVEDL
jgi:uncharacterized protein